MYRTGVADPAGTGYREQLRSNGWRWSFSVTGFGGNENRESDHHRPARGWDPEEARSPCPCKDLRNGPRRGGECSRRQKRVGPGRSSFSRKGAPWDCWFDPIGGFPSQKDAASSFPGIAAQARGEVYPPAIHNGGCAGSKRLSAGRNGFPDQTSQMIMITVMFPGSLGSEMS